MFGKNTCFIFPVCLPTNVSAWILSLLGGSLYLPTTESGPSWSSHSPWSSLSQCLLPWIVTVLWYSIFSTRLWTLKEQGLWILTPMAPRTSQGSAYEERFYEIISSQTDPYIQMLPLLKQSSPPLSWMGNGSLWELLCSFIWVKGHHSGLCEGCSRLTRTDDIHENNMCNVHTGSPSESRSRRPAAALTRVSYHVLRRGVLICQRPCLLESCPSLGWAWSGTARKELFSPK